MKKAIVLMGALSLVSTSVLATESGWYVGVNIGSSKVKDISQSDINDVVLDAFNSAGFQVLSATSSLDDKDTAWSIVGGYKFSRYFAVEAGYADLGGAKYDALGTVRQFGAATNRPATFAADISAKGPQLAAVGIVPLGSRFDLHGKLGMIFAKTTFKETASISGASASDSLSANSTDVFYGLGAGFNVTEHIALNVDWQVYSKVGDEEETGESDIDALTAGLTFSF